VWAVFPYWLLRHASSCGSNKREHASPPPPNPRLDAVTVRLSRPVLVNVSKVTIVLPAPWPPPPFRVHLASRLMSRCSAPLALPSFATSPRGTTRQVAHQPHGSPKSYALLAPTAKTGCLFGEQELGGRRKSAFCLALPCLAFIAFLRKAHTVTMQLDLSNHSEITRELFIISRSCQCTVLI
jgi:hypothetical protein